MQGIKESNQMGMSCGDEGRIRKTGDIIRVSVGQ